MTQKMRFISPKKSLASARIFLSLLKEEITVKSQISDPILVKKQKHFSQEKTAKLPKIIPKDASNFSFRHKTRTSVDLRSTTILR